MLVLERSDLKGSLFPDQRPFDIASPQLDLPAIGLLFELVGASNFRLTGRDFDRLGLDLVPQFLAFFEKFGIHPFDRIIVGSLVLNGLRRKKG